MFEQKHFFRGLLFFMILSAGQGMVFSEEWRVSVEERRGGEFFLTVRNSSINAEFIDRDAWMLARVFYEGVEVVGLYGSNGSVLNVDHDAPWERREKGWLGARHGGEKVISYNIEADGSVFPYNENIAVSGREIRLLKKSEMGPFIFTHIVYFPPSGDYIVQEHNYRVEKSAEGLKYMYAFMHCNSKGFDDWFAALPDESVKEGIADKGDNSNVLRERTVQSVSLYNKEEGMGVSYGFPEAYPGSAWGNFIWDRRRDTKLYFRPRIPSLPEPGSEYSFKVKMTPFRANPEDWKDKALGVLSF